MNTRRLCPDVVSPVSSYFRIENREENFRILADASLLLCVSISDRMLYLTNTWTEACRNALILLPLLERANSNSFEFHTAVVSLTSVAALSKSRKLQLLFRKSSPKSLRQFRQLL